MTNVVGLAFMFAIWTPAELVSHLTNLCPAAAVAVSVTTALVNAAPEFGAPIPIAALLELTITARPSAKFARTAAAPVGIVKVVVGENLLASVTFVRPAPVKYFPVGKRLSRGGVGGG
jgi:hypothetical protein